MTLAECELQTRELGISDADCDPGTPLMQMVEGDAAACANAIGQERSILYRYYTGTLPPVLPQPSVGPDLLPSNCFWVKRGPVCVGLPPLDAPMD